MWILTVINHLLLHMNFTTWHDHDHQFSREWDSASRSPTLPSSMEGRRQPKDWLSACISRDSRFLRCANNHTAAVFLLALCITCTTCTCCYTGITPAFLLCFKGRCELKWRGSGGGYSSIRMPMWQFRWGLSLPSCITSVTRSKTERCPGGLGAENEGDRGGYDRGNLILRNPAEAVKSPGIDL